MVGIALQMYILFLIGFKYPQKCKMLPNYDKVEVELANAPAWEVVVVLPRARDGTKQPLKLPFSKGFGMILPPIIIVLPKLENPTFYCMGSFRKLGVLIARILPCRVLY